jgi:hypothetical protein
MYMSLNRTPVLPQEIINLVLRNVDDDPFLWVSCRQVSRAFRREIEFLFQQTRLRETVLNMQMYRSTFSRLSPDGQTAFFKRCFLTDPPYFKWASRPRWTMTKQDVGPISKPS